MKPITFNKIILAAALWTCGISAYGDDMNNASMSTNAPGMPMMTPADFAWDASMINLKEIRLGEAAQSNSTNPAVQAFGKHMVRDHSRMNERLMKIANAEGLQLLDTNTFYVPVSAPEEKPATEMIPQTPQQKLQQAQLDVQHLVSLTGPDFDQAYADAMVQGHAKAIEKFQDASSSLTDEPLKKFADKGLRSIRMHYEMAQKLQNELMAGTNAPAVSPSGNPPPM
jgi:putative membrane protein